MGCISTSSSSFGQSIYPVRAVLYVRLKLSSWEVLYIELPFPIYALEPNPVRPYAEWMSCVKLDHWDDITARFMNRAMHLSKSYKLSKKKKQVEMSARVIWIKPFDLGLKTGLTKRTQKEDKSKCQNLFGKTSFILCRLHGFIGLPVMISLMDNAIHHFLRRKWGEGWGHGDIVQ